MNKKELRIKYRGLRKNISQSTLEDHSLAIANQIIQMKIWDRSFYHVFLSIESQKEVNTEFILHILSGKDKNIVISRSNFETRKMTHFLLTDSIKIKKNKYDIPEPLDGIEIDSNKIDVVFIPLLAFDKKGNRVGYGKGFYDNFLAECRPDVIKIGLSFFEPENEITGVFESDVQLDYCVTPDRIYQF